MLGEVIDFDINTKDFVRLAGSFLKTQRQVLAQYAPKDCLNG
jgi:hypothetical protein